MRRPAAITLVALLALCACSTAAVPSSTPAAALPSASPSPSAMLTSSTAPVATTATPSATPLALATAGAAHAPGVSLLDYGCAPDVARCQDMAAGTYETAGTWALLRGLAVTLPAGWSSAEQDAGEFELHQASDSYQVNEIYFWRDLVAWVDGAPKPALGTTADEFAAYLLGDSRMTVVEGPGRTFDVRGPDSLSVAGTVAARSFSVIVSDSAHTDPDAASGCPGTACIAVFTDPVHWQGGLDLARDMAAPVAGCPCSQVLRLYVASVGRDLHPHMFVVAVSTAGPDPLKSLSAWEAQVEPIIDSVLVPYIVVDN